MNKVSSRLSELFESNQDRKLLSIYCTAGYPHRDALPGILATLQEEGVDFVELGMPYSDPLADGPTIQECGAQAIENGMTMSLLFEQVEEARKIVSMPFVWMGYLNAVLQFGMDRFLESCERCGIDAVIIPDLPPEVYAAEYQERFEAHGVGVVFLITPRTSEARIRLMDGLSSGFIYLVSSPSLTGRNSGVSDATAEYLKRIHGMNLRNPKMVGFGIHDRDSFSKAVEFAEGAIIGSAFLNSLENDACQDSVRTFVQKII